MKRYIILALVLTLICFAVVILFLPVIKAQNTELQPQKQKAEIYVQTGHPSSIYSIAFSPDGKTLASGSWDLTIKLWNVETGQLIKTLSGHIIVGSLAFSSDGEIIAAGGGERTVNPTIELWNVKAEQIIKSLDETNPNTARELASVVPDFENYEEPMTKNKRFQIKIRDNSNLDLYEVKTGKLLASLITLDKTDWAVVAPDGYFDGTPNAWRRLSWRLSDKLYDIAPVEAFFNEFYRPGLLQEIFAGKTIEKPTRDISTIDIRQPEVKIRLSNANQTAANAAPRQVTVNVEIKDAPADEKRKMTGGAKDVRLFRNGSLVKLWSGDVLGGKPSVTLTATIPVIAGDNKFTAYAFNGENIKSNDATAEIKGADSLKRDGTLYILAIGVNAYANSDYNLLYAVADVEAVSESIQKQQNALGKYPKTEIVKLTDKDATKANIFAALNRFGNDKKALPENAPADLQKIKLLQPEDALVIYYAGHGTASKDRFYLIPHDGFPTEKNPDEKIRLEKIYAASVSDKDLEDALEPVDAGKILMVIDACNSGQALESEEKRRGPMNSKGLAQLAYEKGIYILTAAQSRQSALEVSKLGHGLLTFALLEGLQKADRDASGNITERKWLDFATAAVPQLQVAAMETRSAENKTLPPAQKRSELAFATGDNTNLPPEKRGLQVPRVFYRRELETRPMIIAKP